MVVDCHAHIGSSWLGWFENEVDARGLIKIYDRFGVDKACINSWQINYDIRAGNDEVCEAVREFPDRLVGFAIVSPRYGRRALYEIDRCVQELNMRGLKLHPSAGSWHADSDIVDPVMERAGKFKLPVLFHSWSDSFSHPRAIGNVASRFPDVPIIMGHMGFEDWLEAVMVARKNKNILLDTTGTTSDVIIIKTAYEELGPTRIVFGSDAPALGVGPEMAKIQYAEIPEEAKKMILGENMASLLGLN